MPFKKLIFITEDLITDKYTLPLQDKIYELIQTIPSKLDTAIKTQFDIDIYKPIEHKLITHLQQYVIYYKKI